MSAIHPKTETEYGIKMRELAKKEGHEKKHPEKRVANGLSQGERRRCERVLDVLRANGPLTRRELASAMGISYSYVYDYARPLIASGEVVRTGEHASLVYHLKSEIRQ